MSSSDTVIQVGKRQYDLGPTLGVGGFSEVKRGIDKTTGKRVALKITYTDGITSQREMNNQLRSVQKEIKSMKKLNHQNIVRLLGYDLKCNVEGKNAIVMVQELAPKGELFDYLMHTQKFDQRTAIAVFKQLVSALGFIHSKGIAHRDLKPENLLFDKDFNLKIVDFGFSYIFKKNDNPRTLMRTELGTKGYMAPEILDHTKYTEKADIFAAGVILFICLAGFPPFQDAQSNDWWFDKLKKKKYRLFWMAHERTATFSPEAKTILQDMLAADPNERLDVEGIKRSAFMNSEHLDKNALRAELTRRKAEVDRQKAEDRAKEAVTRDTFQEAVSNYMLERSADDTLQLKNLVQSDLRNQFKGVADTEDLRAVFEHLVGKSVKLKGLEKIDVNEIDLSKVPDLAHTMKLTDVQDVLKVNEREANIILTELDTSTVIGHIEDYDPNLFEQLQGVDDLEIPLFDPYYYKSQSYKTPASLGLLVYSFQKYLNKRGFDAVEVQLETTSGIPTIKMRGDLEKVFEIPVETDDGDVEFQEATMAVPLVIDVCVFRDTESPNNIITFSNGNVQTTQEYTTMEKELTTDREYSLLASILCEDPVVQTDSEAFQDIQEMEETLLPESDPALDALVNPEIAEQEVSGEN
jgi:serine/threonine protein kinase